MCKRHRRNIVQSAQSELASSCACRPCQHIIFVATTVGQMSLIGSLPLAPISSRPLARDRPLQNQIRSGVTSGSEKPPAGVFMLDNAKSPTSRRNTLQIRFFRRIRAGLKFLPRVAVVTSTSRTSMPTCGSLQPRHGWQIQTYRPIKYRRFMVT
jgi:hypothetical protein